MIKQWFIPTWCGDYRFEAIDDDSCKLIVVDPTLAEIEVLGAFLGKARKKKWADPATEVKGAGESELVINASIVKAGKLLLGRKRPRKGLLTAIKSKAGEIETVTGVEEEAEKALEKPEAEKSVSVRRPTLCCPVPITGPEKRASKVLETFSTERQWDTWQEHGFLLAYGNLSGHRYRIAHRHSKTAKEQGKIAWDLDSGCVVHCYDWAVPPQEEVLSVKLVLEHREQWIRNHSGMLGIMDDSEGMERFVNPFMSENHQGEDGIPDASFISRLGRGLKKVQGS